MQPDRVGYLRDELAKDEQWALACNRPYEYADEGSKAPDSGVRWRWIAGENWETVEPDPVTMEMIEGPGGDHRARLATVEEWPSTLTLRGEQDTRMMPRTYAGSVEEMDPSAAGHIIRHDPARVLRQVAAHRRILDEYEALAAECQGEPESAAVLDWVERVVLPALAGAYQEPCLRCSVHQSTEWTCVCDRDCGHPLCAERRTDDGGSDAG